MCGRFAVKRIDIAALIERYAIGNVAAFDWPTLMARAEFHPKGEAAIVLTVPGGPRTMDHAYWDLVPHWWKTSLKEKRFASFNVRSDALAKPSFYGAWERGQRCIVPATEFFAWPDRDGDAPKNTPRDRFSVTLEGGGLFSMAAIWDLCLLPGEKTPFLSFGILTTDASTPMGAVPHSRMPAILNRDREGAWLDPNTRTSEAFGFIAPREDITVEKVA
jgi:putative SOS response-associated peptidase YedK